MKPAPPVTSSLRISDLRFRHQGSFDGFQVEIVPVGAVPGIRNIGPPRPSLQQLFDMPGQRQRRGETGRFDTVERDVGTAMYPRSPNAEVRCRLAISDELGPDTGVGRLQT